MKLSALLVSDYMTPNPIVIEPEEPLMRALEIVRLRGVRRLPVPPPRPAAPQRVRERLYE